MIDRYESLADTERRLRVVRFDVVIGLACYRLPDSIRAHVNSCFLALAGHLQH